MTNHARVLFCLAEHPDLRLREVADRIAITERAVQRIVTDLEAAGILMRSREGRRNRYEINPSERLRHPNEAHCTVGDLLTLARDDPGKLRPVGPNPGASAEQPHPTDPSLLGKGEN